MTILKPRNQVDPYYFSFLSFYNYNQVLPINFFPSFYDNNKKRDPFPFKIVYEEFKIEFMNNFMFVFSNINKTKLSNHILYK